MWLSQSTKNLIIYWTLNTSTWVEKFKDNFSYPDRFWPINAKLIESYLRKMWRSRWDSSSHYFFHNLWEKLVKSSSPRARSFVRRTRFRTYKKPEDVMHRLAAAAAVWARGFKCIFILLGKNVRSLSVFHAILRRRRCMHNSRRRNTDGHKMQLFCNKLGIRKFYLRLGCLLRFL